MKNKKSTDCVLLGVLMLGSKHGYEIRQFLDEALESKWHIGNSQMYSLLKQLEEKRLLESYIKIQAKRPSKRIYTLTFDGKTKFLQWIEGPVMHVRHLRIEFIAKLFFIHRLSLASGNLVIQTQIDALEHILLRIKEIHWRESLPFERLSLQFRQVTIEAYIQWLETAAYEFVKKI